MDFKFGNLIFSSNFDSGNLSNVEKVISNDDNGNNHYNSQSETIKIDYDFNIWTRPDCHRTEYENGNRTWFYFYVKGYSPGKMIRITIKNLNRQQRLYAQGYCPLFKIETNNKDSEKWCRVRYRPTWENNDANFQLTFTHRLSEIKSSVTYFAFCYPWSYSDCQKQLEALDSKYNHCANCSWDTLNKFDRRTIYYKRELFAKSIEGRRIDLITITDLEGILNEQEEIYDEKLFPDKGSRPWKFSNKKVFVVTSRVHPGETPSSHVFNGFLNFILRSDDPRSVQLRRQFIFKLIPLLNPDGVFHGHYRTDMRGVNLNRVYLNPDFEIHSPIYAAKSLLVYHHIYNSDDLGSKLSIIKSKVFTNIVTCHSSRDVIVTEDSTLTKLVRDEDQSDRKLYVINGARMSKVVDSTLSNSYRAISSGPVEINDVLQQDHHFPAIRRSGYSGNNDTTPTPKNPISDNLLIEDCSEVFVDTDSLKCELESPENCVKSDAMSLGYKSFSGGEQKCDSQLPNFVDDEEMILQRQSIQKIFNPESRSNSIPVINIRGQQLQWNLRGNHANLMTGDDQLSNEPHPQAIRLHKKQRTSMIPLPLRPAIVSMRFNSKKLGKVSLDSSQLSSLKNDLPACNGLKSEPRIGNEGSDDDSDLECFVGRNGNAEDSFHLCDPCLLEIPVERSGVAFYIDLHGHCSKRGCFMYGNCLENDKTMNDNVLYPKLISLNSPHFDFLGCNFSLRNMYTKDKKDGTSKEGAGRVAMWKHLGLTHSYTLECNYNTGRTVNSIPPPSKDDGKASPPLMDPTCLLPPKYTPVHFEEVGKAMAIAALDMSHTNPWSRIINSEYSTLQNVREFVRRFLTGQRNGIRQSISFRHRYNKAGKQAPNNGIPSLSKTLSNQLDYRRVNGSQNYVSMSAPRKSQTSITPNLSYQNCNLIKPILTSGPVSAIQQLNVDCDNVTLDYNKEHVNNCTSDQNNGSVRINSSVTTILSKVDQMIRSESSRTVFRNQEPANQRLSCTSSQINPRPKQDVSPLVNKYIPSTLKSDDENYTNKSNENMTSGKQVEFRRNSIADCYPDETLYNILEKEKLDELKEILSDEKCFKSISSSSKTDSYNFDKRSFQLKKPSSSKKKVLGKIISYSTNDINY